MCNIRHALTSLVIAVALGYGGGADAADAALPDDPTPCVDGSAGGYPCSGISLRRFVTYESMGKSPSAQILDNADIWGWIDPQSAKEYALVALTDVTGIGVVDVTDPEAPVVVGNLRASRDAESGERDVKVYKNHAYVVAGSSGHGMDVYDLTRLRGVTPPETLDADFRYTDFGEAKNLAINEESGFAYVALAFGGGGEECDKGLYILDIRSPKNPTFAGCHAPGAVLDGQCVTYAGPDAAHAGREICLISTVTQFQVVDVTVKNAPVALSSTAHPDIEHVNNGWLTEDQRYYLVSDYKDEVERGVPTRTHVFDVADLDAPLYLYSYEADTYARDHNLFVVGNRVFQGNYAAGLRVLEFGDLANGELTEVAFFDTAPDDDTNTFGVGAGSVYPFFPSGTLVVNDQHGLFIFSLDVPGATGNFDADADSDVLLRHVGNQWWRLFEMQDFAVASNASVSLFNSAVWTHQVNADFDADGDADVLLRRDDGLWRVFEIENGAVVGSTLISVFQNLAWKFQAAVDADGDGDADLLARKTDSGAWRLFTVQDRQVVGSAGIALYPNSVWQFQGAADYDADGDGDVLMRRTDKGWWRIFQLENAALVGAEPVGPLFIGSDWHYVTSGDMDRDGDAEIVLRRQSTGDWRVFRLHNRRVQSVQALNLFTNLLWRHEQTGDFDADGDGDLLLKKSGSGQWRIFQIQNLKSVGSHVPTIWQNLNLQVQN